MIDTNTRLSNPLSCKYFNDIVVLSCDKPSSSSLSRLDKTFKNISVTLKHEDIFNTLKLVRLNKLFNIFSCNNLHPLNDKTSKSIKDVNESMLLILVQQFKFKVIMNINSLMYYFPKDQVMLTY